MFCLKISYPEHTDDLGKDGFAFRTFAISEYGARRYVSAQAVFYNNSLLGNQRPARIWCDINRAVDRFDDAIDQPIDDTNLSFSDPERVSFNWRVRSEVCIAKMTTPAMCSLAVRVTETEGCFNVLRSSAGTQMIDF